MEKQKGFAIIPIMLLIALFGVITSGLVTFEKGKAVLHKEVLKQGKPDYSTTNK